MRLRVVVPWITPVLIAFVASCGGDPASSSLVTRSDTDPDPVTSASAASVVERGLLPPPRMLPGPAPQGRAASYDPVAENQACTACHQAIADDWYGSLHRLAWDDPVFLAAYAVEPIAFCKDCHAPEVRSPFVLAAAGRDPSRSDESRHLGVACTTCHVVGDAIVGATSHAGGDHHPVQENAAIRTSAWCAGCHEFDFPEPQPALMQSTIAEHRASQHADTACVDCHMPLVGDPPRRSHAFRVQGDAAFLASALSAEARKGTPRSIEIDLRVTGAGHAVPTGDMFRRLEARAYSGDQPVASVVLAREFRKEGHGGGSRRIQSADRRLPASGEPTTVELFFPRKLEDDVHWSVVYQRMGPQEAALFGVDLARDETIVATGVIRWEQER